MRFDRVAVILQVVQMACPDSISQPVRSYIFRVYVWPTVSMLFSTSEAAATR